jgi:hypothetical protein
MNAALLLLILLILQTIGRGFSLTKNGEKVKTQHLWVTYLSIKSALADLICRPFGASSRRRRDIRIR